MQGIWRMNLATLAKSRIQPRPLHFPALAVPWQAAQVLCALLQTVSRLHSRSLRCVNDVNVPPAHRLSVSHIWGRFSTKL